MDDFKEKENIDLSSDIQTLRLTEAAEKQRSNYQLLKTTIHLPFITADKTGPKHEKN
jgi:molecular chaperone DnaK (HSP70)